MDIRNSVDGLRTLLGVPSANAAQTQPAKNNGASGAASAFAGDRATLSSSGSEVAQTASDTGVRADKVAAVQAALAAGTYSVPASAVAGRLVDAMLGGWQPVAN